MTTTTSTSTTPCYYLGIDLSPDILRAVILDDHLDIISADSVPFPNNSDNTTSSTSTLELSNILNALDTLLSKLSSRTNLSYVKSIGGSSFPSTVFYSHPQPPNNASSTDPASSLDNIWSPSFAVPTIPTPTDTSPTPFAQLIQDSPVFGPSPARMAQRCGTSAFAGPLSGFVAAQLIKLRLSSPDLWSTGVIAVSSLSALLQAIFSGGSVGAVGGPSLADALTWGLLDYSWLGTKPEWDRESVAFVAGSEQVDDAEVGRVLHMLGEINSSPSSSTIARYFIDKYNFDKDTVIQPFTSTHLATYLSLVPTTSDAVLSFGTQDAMIFSCPPQTQSPTPVPTPLAQSFPHPAQDPSSPQREWISVLTARNGDVPRTLVRDMYTKSWSAFDRLVAIVPPGGSIGLDDKLFSFWFLQPESESCYINSPSSNHYTNTKSLQTSNVPNSNGTSPPRGIFRFENGTKVTEFRDLRANPRCLVEGQIMAFRMRFGRVVSSSSSSSTNGSSNGALPNGHNNNNNTNGHYHPTSTSTSTPTSTPSLPFNPYTSAPLPNRIFATGTASYFPSIVNVVGEVFNAPVFVPQSVLEEGVVWAGMVTALQQASNNTGGSGGGGNGEDDESKEKEKEKDNATALAEAETLSSILTRIPSRAAIGGAYIARWNWKRGGGAGTPSGSSFEDDIRLLLAKRWAQQQQQQQQHLNSAITPSSSSGLGFGFGFGGGFGHSLPSSSQSALSPLSAFSSLASLTTLNQTTQPPSLSLSLTPQQHHLSPHHHGLPTPTSATTTTPSTLSPWSHHLHNHHHQPTTLSKPGRLHRAKSNLALASEVVVEEDESEGAEGDEGENGESGVAVQEEASVAPPRDSGVYKYPIVSVGNVVVSGPGGGGGGTNSNPVSIPLTTPISQTPPPPPPPTSIPTQPPSLTLTTTNPTSSTGPAPAPGPLTSILGPAPTQPPLTSTLHPIAPLTTNDADAQFGLVKVAEPDEDGFVCYAAMVWEWVRLEGGVWAGLW